MLLIKLTSAELALNCLDEKYTRNKYLKLISVVDAVYHHSKLQLETERRVQALANDLWLQQAEISRSQEQSLQETLNSIIKQNRKLQEDNGDLLRKNEQLQTKLTSLAYLSPRGVYGEKLEFSTLYFVFQMLNFRGQRVAR